MRYTQPQSDQKIDWGNPITRGLVLASNHAIDLRNIAGNTGSPSLINSPTVNVYRAGRAYKFAKTSTQAINYGNSSALNPQRFTLFSQFQINAALDASDEYMLISRDDATLGRAYVLSLNGSGNAGVRAYINGGGGSSLIAEGTQPSVGMPHTAAYTLNDGSVVLYRDGRRVASATGAGSVNSTTGNTLVGMRTYSSSPSAMEGSIGLSLIYGRALSAVEIKSLSENPWQIFADSGKPIFIGVDASPSGLSVAAELATATASGYAVTVSVQSAITVTLATATASGFTASVDSGNTITAAIATATANGQAAAVNLQSNLAATVAVATAPGQPATVAFGNTIGATQAIASAAGFDAGVDLRLTVAAALTTATAAGFDAGVSNGSAIAANQGVATASGFDVVVNRQLSVLTTVATATASGVDASISNGASIAASYGLASADGYQAQVNLRREIAASLATASASGFIAAISTSTGAAIYPTPDQVLAGITYGPTGADYTGTATAGGYPTAADIAAAIRVDLSSELARIDAAISSRATVAAILGATVP